MPWAVGCNGKVLGDSDPLKILKYLQSAKVPNLPDLYGRDFTYVKYALASIGVFTIARTTTDDFEALSISTAHLNEAGSAVGS